MLVSLRDLVSYEIPCGSGARSRVSCWKTRQTFFRPLDLQRTDAEVARDRIHCQFSNILPVMIVELSTGYSRIGDTQLSDW